MRTSRIPILVLTAVLLGCATAEQPKEPAVDSVPIAVVNEAMAKLREAGLELTLERDAAIEAAEKAKKDAHDCQVERRT